MSLNGGKPLYAVCVKKTRNDQSEDRHKSILLIGYRH